MQTLTRIKAAALTVCVFAAPVANADTLNVPGDFPTIQAAIDAAVNGDVVLIAPGVYTGEGNRDLDTLGKAITIRGDGGGDPAMVVIDAQGTSSEDHRGMRIVNAADVETVLEALTIRNGQLDLDYGAGIRASGEGRLVCRNVVMDTCLTSEWGAAIFNEGLEVELLECLFVGNWAVEGAAYWGHGRLTVRESRFEANRTQGEDEGVVFHIQDQTPSVLIEDCEFIDNGSASQGDGVAAHIAATVPAVIRRCVFEDNAGDDGGVLHEADMALVEDCIFLRNRGGDVGGVIGRCDGTMFIRCIFEENRIRTHGGVMQGNGTFIDCVFRRNDSGLFGGVVDGNGLFVNCLFEENTADSGGAVRSVKGSTFVGCRFLGNDADFEGGAVEGGNLAFIDCEFLDNSGGSSFPGGGALFLSGDAFLVNCTFGNNTSGDPGSVAYVEDTATLTAHNCIFWDNPGDDFAGPGTITINYSDVEGGFAGTGNIDADPLFINAAAGDYRLSPGSPCIDAGDNLALPPDTHDLDNDGDTTEPLPIDLFGLARRVDDPNTTDTGNGTPPIVDMGAYEFQTQGTAAMFADVTVEFGTHLGGNLKSLRVSDDERFEMQSQFGFSAMEPNIAQLRLGVMNHAPSPGVIALRVESMLNNPGGAGTLRLRDWGTGTDEVVHQFATSQRDSITTMKSIDASPYIRASDGRAELSARFAVIATFAATGFEARVDQAVVFVE